MQPTLIRLAIAEDHTMVRQALKALLERIGGFEIIIEAGNGRELLQQLENTKHLPDICLLDISMPVLNGFDTLVELRKKWPRLKVLALSMFGDEMYVLRMIRNGANGYLLKESSVEELTKALHDIHHAGYYISSLVSRQLINVTDLTLGKLPRLTEKELQLLRYCGTDLSYEQIATEMHTTVRSVQGYRDSLFKKLNVNSRVSLAMFAIRAGITPIERLIAIGNDSQPITAM